MPPCARALPLSLRTSTDAARHGTWEQEFRPTFRADDRVGMSHERPGGTLLSVCWPNGRIANYPLYFPSLEGEHNKPPWSDA